MAPLYHMIPWPTNLQAVSFQTLHAFQSTRRISRMKELGHEMQQFHHRYGIGGPSGGRIEVVGIVC